MIRHLSPPRGAARLVLALASLAPLPLAAQAGDSVLVEPRPAIPVETTLPAPAEVPEEPGVSPLLPPEYWAVRAASRAEALGLVRAWVPAQRAVPRERVRAALAEAAEAARSRGDAGVAALAEGWARRFAEEFRTHAAGAGGAVRIAGASLGAGFRDWEGRLTPARGAFDFRRDPVALPDLSEGTAAASLGVDVGQHLTLFAEGRAAEGGVDAPRWEAAAGWGAWALSVGRMPVAYGTGRGGGIVLSGTPLERVEVRTERPVRLPGFLRYLGPVSAHTSVSRFTEERHPGDPYFWAMRGAFQPHPRFTVGINRATVFGGDSISTPVTLGNVAKMFIGVLSRDFENQVVSVDGRFRVPSEGVLPLTLYLEWGAEDASGAWWKVPGILAGAFVPAVPGVPQLGVGAEYTRFDDFCCGNPPWYFHAAQRGGWALDGAPLGHPLGGEGSEALAYAVAELWEARLRLEGRAFVRERGAEGFAKFQRAGNLFVPQREGRSRGGSVEAAARLFGRADVRASWFRDAGDGWTEQRFTAGASLFL